MFTGDPFNMFGDINHHMRQQMREMDRMMNSMMDPFGMFNRHSMFAGMLEDAPRSRPSHRDDMALMDPFGGGFFGGMMRQMENLQAQAMNDPNSHVFSHSTMISFDGRNGGQPRVVEKSFRKSGDVKETRHAIRTGDDDGVGDKLTIGHTIGDRTHVIEKKRDRDGRIRERQSFVNLGQDEAEAFDREFASRARRNLMGGRTDVRHAIEGGKTHSGPSNGRSRHASRISGSGTGGPIVTLPDEEDDSDANENEYGNGKRSGTRSASASGPVIREVTDDEDEDNDVSGHKRRKGVFGRLFKANDE